MTPPAGESRRILVQMCVLIAVDQRGFGGGAVLALYARSFRVSQTAIGLATAVFMAGGATSAA